MPIIIPEIIESHPEPPGDLIANDGEPMEDGWHRSQMNLLIDSVHYHWRNRKNFYAGGNMFIYFSRQKVFNKDFRGPDFFLVKNCEWNPDRLYWALWDEAGRYPNLIVELLSASSKITDRVTKKALYGDTFKTPEYYIFDRKEPKLESFHLGPQTKYKPGESDKSGAVHALAEGDATSAMTDVLIAKTAKGHTALDLHNLLTVSEAIARAAVERKESRGGHFRDDFPAKDPEFAKFNYSLKKSADGAMQIEKIPIPEMPAELKAIIEEMG